VKKPAPGQQITLSTVGIEAAALLAALCGQSFGDSGEAWSEADFFQILGLPTTVALIAEAETHSESGEGEKSPAGFVLFMKVVDAGVMAQGEVECEILTLGVLPASRKIGIGRRLVEAVVEQCRRTGPLTNSGSSSEFRPVNIFLEVRADNAAALALYERQGFVTAGRRKAYYLMASGAQVDAILMKFNIH
jgi:ribosomal-protein-alanine N-acetyltransferase